jgi:23S rRNA (cytidine1920-2'-O)/16S rRNA (cytidine1409-2'-O)-methyltransferase
MARRRLDAELVRRDLARSREQAQGLIAAGEVSVRGLVARKPATQVDEADPIVVAAPADAYVSRGAHKLRGALAAFPVDPAGRDCLDAGASTGGFTQVLLERDAARVCAVDVGYGQLAWPLRTDPRVAVLDRTNARTLAPGDLPWPPSVVVADLSFISLTLVLPALSAVAAPEPDLLVMVKPQFEVGREAVGDGVVRDPDLRREAVVGVARAAATCDLDVHGAVASPLPGPRGNVEYFLWLRRGRMGVGAQVVAAIDAAVREGPT